MATDERLMTVLVCLPAGLFGDALARAMQSAPADVTRVVEAVEGTFDVVISLEELGSGVVAPLRVTLPHGEAGPAVVIDLTGTTEVHAVIDLVDRCRVPRITDDA